MSRKRLSLRGTLNVTLDALEGAGAAKNPHQIFSYEDNDLTRGWKIVEAYVWAASVQADFGANTGQFLMQTVLHTDTGLNMRHFGKWGAFDNRIIGWNNTTFQERAGDFPSNNASSFSTASKMIIDPDHVISRDLYISLQSQSDGGGSPEMEWNYLVIMEPKKMDPKETILSIIKSVAQDVSN